MESAQKEWLEFKECLRRSLPLQTCKSWLEPLQLLRITPSKVVMCGIPHEVYRYDIKTNHEPLFRQVLDELYPEKGPFSQKCFEYKIGNGTKHPEIVQTEFDLNQPESDIPEDSASLAGPLFAVAQAAKTPASSSGCSGFGEGPAFFGNSAQYLLESYIPGERNLLASRAAQIVADLSGSAFNPFVIYGESGAGKTHLLEGIAHAIRRKNPQMRIVQISAEDFLNDFTAHIRSKQMKEFRERYRSAEVFLLDDLQVLAASTKCQTELLYTINTLRQQGAQIVAAGQDPLGKTSKLNPELRGRLESGLAVDVGAPDELTRIAILERKAKERGIPLNRKLAEFMVCHIEGGIGRLEGALMRLGVHASLLNEELTVDLARLALSDRLSETPENPQPPAADVPAKAEHPLRNVIPLPARLPEHPADAPEAKILQRIYAMFQVSEKDFLSHRRDNRITKARQAAVYLLKELTPLSFNEIGNLLGRNHSTIHATLRKAEEQMSADDFFHKQMQILRQELGKKPLAVLPFEQKLRQRM